ncbi:hypothetical protein [Roseofilum capinflatum]|uniref:Uncharacterized protein n=1 Tax=Roseofilum capinflatum BLCC-M114 TaxID=3022440 RepID=A0ABT7B6P4_9CYAN|nr:hypothetical protein [Roseofilum capinflatum]MDJ1174820.1 hypothetical protein [Roseofilum capinflatum BLCC-M114]
MSKFGKDQFKRNNVLTLVEALLKFTEGKVMIEKQKLDALEKPVTLYSRENKDLADCQWEPNKPLLLPGDSKNKGITKEALWLLVECSALA